MDHEGLARWIGATVVVYREQREQDVRMRN